MKQNEKAGMEDDHVLGVASDPHVMGELRQLRGELREMCAALRKRFSWDDMASWETQSGQLSVGDSSNMASASGSRAALLACYPGAHQNAYSEPTLPTHTQIVSLTDLHATQSTTAVPQQASLAQGVSTSNVTPSLSPLSCAAGGPSMLTPAGVSTGSTGASLISSNVAPSAHPASAIGGGMTSLSDGRRWINAPTLRTNGPTAIRHEPVAAPTAYATPSLLRPAAPTGAPSWGGSHKGPSASSWVTRKDEGGWSSLP